MQSLCFWLEKRGTRKQLNSETKKKKQKIEVFEYPPLQDKDKITIEQYQAFSPAERADVNILQLRHLFLTVTHKEASTYLGGNEIRKNLEQRLNIKPVCSCGGEEFLGVTSRACDNNYYVLPNKQEGEGYFPPFSGLASMGGDGPSFDMCIKCGRIYGFDPLEMKMSIHNALLTLNENKVSDDDDDDDDDENDENDFKRPPKKDAQVPTTTRSKRSAAVTARKKAVVVASDDEDDDDDD